MTKYAGNCEVFAAQIETDIFEMFWWLNNSNSLNTVEI